MSIDKIIDTEYISEYFLKTEIKRNQRLLKKLAEFMLLNENDKFIWFTDNRIEIKDIF